MNYGDFIIFDPRCLHCTQYNDTKDTRVSMDIRIIMESAFFRNYSREYKTTGRKKMPFYQVIISLKKQFNRITI